jgi:ankyrin repeat protein
VVELVDDDDEIRPLLLHEAVRSNGDLNYAMKTDTSTLNTLDTSGFTPLHLACLHNNYEALEFLLRYRADVHRLDRQGETALHMAAYRGLTHFASALLDAGSNINQRGKNGETALHKACRSRSLKDDGQIVEYLLGRGAEASAVNDYGDTVLHILANQPGTSSSVARCVDLCMRFGAWSVIDAQNHFGNTPLLKSLWEVNSSMVQILLDKGARCDIVSHKGLSVLHAAGRIGSEEIIKLLLSRSARILGLDIRSRSIDGLTPIGELRRAIHRDRGDAAAVEMVKDRNPTPREIQAFEALLRDVRDGHIAAEVQELEEAIWNIRHDSIKEAQKSLQEIIRFKQKAGIDSEETAALQTVEIALYEGELEGKEKAVLCLREIIEKANLRLSQSPYEEEPEVGDR